jgi:hypothetical protein
MHLVLQPCGTDPKFGEHAAKRPALLDPPRPQVLLQALLRSLQSPSSGETVGMRTHRPRPAPLPRSAFAGFRFPPDVIIVAVRWYLRFGLSYRDVEELLTERGVEVDHVTVYRWVQRFTPLLAGATRPCRHAMGSHWQVDRPTSRWLAAGGMYRAWPDLRCSAHPAKFLNPTSPGPNDCDEEPEHVVEVGTTAEDGCGPGG